MGYLHPVTQHFSLNYCLLPLSAPQQQCHQVRSLLERIQGQQVLHSVSMWWQLLLTLIWAINSKSVQCSQGSGDPKAITAQGHCQVIKQSCYSHYDLSTLIYRCKHQWILNEYCRATPTVRAIRVGKYERNLLEFLTRNGMSPEEHRVI